MAKYLDIVIGAAIATVVGLFITALWMFFKEKIKKIYRGLKMWMIGVILIIIGYLFIPIGGYLIFKSQKNVVKSPIESKETDVRPEIVKPISTVQKEQTPSLKDWTEYTKFPPGHQVYDMLQLSNGDFIIYTYYNSNFHVFVSHDNKETWDKYQPLDVRGLFGNFLEVDKKVLVAGQSQNGYAKIYKSEDYGVSWDEVDLPGQFGMVSNIIKCPNDTLILSTVAYNEARHQFATLLQSVDKGTTWKILEEFKEQSSVDSLFIDSNNVIWASTSFAKEKALLFFSKNFGKDWVEVNTLPHDKLDIRYIRRIFETRQNRVFIAIEQTKTFDKTKIDFVPFKILATSDYAKTWENITLLGGNTSKIWDTHYSKKNNTLYVATDIGLFSSQYPSAHQEWTFEYKIEGNAGYSRGLLNEGKDNILLYLDLYKSVIKKLKSP